MVLNRKRIRALTIALTLVDENGKRLFGDSPAEIDALAGKGAKAIDRILEVSKRLNLVTAKDEDELAKNSSGEPTADSPSGSPPNSESKT